MKQETSFENNNLDLLRLILALIVVLVHSSELSQLNCLAVLPRFLNSNFAIKGFFIISGMLIYRSYLRSSSLYSYFTKRLRRIYPAYVTVLIISCFLLGPLSTESWRHYLGAGLWKYIFANLLFLNFLAPGLPGVFLSNPFTSAINGALWTLKIEVGFYVCVPVLHWLSMRFGITRVIGSVAILSLSWQSLCELMIKASHSGTLWTKLLEQLPAQLLYFAIGILLVVHLDYLKKKFLAIGGLTLIAYCLDRKFLHGHIDFIWIAGVVLLAAFSYYLGNFSKYGDFSYGIYIVHFPILQSAIALGLASLGAPLYLSFSLFTCFVTAVALWNLIEKPFLHKRSHYIEKLAT